MKIFSWNDIYTAESNSPCYNYFTGSALTIGGFDGPHLGHKVLCTRVLEKAAKKHLQSGIVTFSRSPRLLKQKTNYAGDISTLRIRLNTFEQWGFDFVVVIDFSTDFSKIEGTTFLRVLYEKCAMRFLAVGENFRCGYKNAVGTAEIEYFANEHNIRFVLAPLVETVAHQISSSMIRQCVLSGKLKKVAELLGHPFLLDCRFFDWLFIPWESEENTFSFLLDRFQVSQVLPPNGRYRVHILMPNKKEFFFGVLYLDESNLRLEVPEVYKNEQFDVLAF